MENLIANNKIRKPTIAKLFRTSYYRSEKYSFREKVYTYLYRDINQEITFIGEEKWWRSHVEKIPELVNILKREFTKDYSDYCTKN